MCNRLKEFVEISKYAGMREDLVQAGGGNSSYKISEDEMVIKASGFQLADLTDDIGITHVNPKMIFEAFLQRSNIDSIGEEESKEILKEAVISGGRPSIETFLHSISGKYTLHTHPIVVNALACRKGGDKILHELFPEAIIVPYSTPGVELAKQYFKLYKESGEVIVKEAFLLNHGLLVSGDSAQEVVDRTEKIIRDIEAYLGTSFDHYRYATELWRLLEKEGIVWTVTDKNVLQVYERSHDFWEHCFCPDCVVFLGKRFVRLMDGNKEKINDFRKKYGHAVIYEYRDNLYIHATSVKKALEIQSVLSFSAQVAGINSGYVCDILSENEQNFLLNWDAEKYRKNLK